METIERIQRELETLTRSGKSDTIPRRITLLNQLSIEYMNVSPDEALTQASGAYELSLEIKDEGHKCRSLINMGDACRHLNRFDEAVLYFEQAVSLSKAGECENEAGNALNGLGLAYQSSGKNKEALKEFLKARKVFYRSQQYERVAITNMLIGNIYYFWGDYVKAVDYYNESLKELEKKDDLNTQAKLLNNIAVIYQKQNHFDDALEYFIKTLELRDKIGDRRGIAFILNNIGKVYRLKGNNQMAYDNYEHAMKIFSELGQDNHQAIAIMNLAEICSERKEYVKSERLFHEALDIFKSINRRSGQAQIFNELGELELIWKNDIRAAVEHFANSAKLFKILGDNSKLIEVLVKLGYCFNRLHEYTNSRSYLFQALDISDDDTEIEIMKSLYDELTEVSKNITDYKRAFEFSIKSKEITEKLYEKDIDSKINEVKEKLINESAKTKAKIIDEKNIEIENYKIEIEKLKQDIEHLERRMESAQSLNDKFQDRNDALAQSLHELETRLKETEQAVGSVDFQTARIYENLLELFPDMVVILNDRNEVIYANTKSRQLFGLTNQRFSNLDNELNVHNYINSLNVVSVLGFRTDEIYKGNEVLVEHKEIILPDLESRMVDILGLPFSVEADSFTGVALFIRDTKVTELRDEELRKEMSKDEIAHLLSNIAERLDDFDNRLEKIATEKPKANPKPDPIIPEQIISSNYMSSIPELEMPEDIPEEKYDSKREILKELTDREAEIALLIAEGMSSKSIGKKLEISPTTVQKHRNRIRQKLDLSNEKTTLKKFLADNLT